MQNKINTGITNIYHSLGGDTDLEAVGSQVNTHSIIYDHGGLRFKASIECRLHPKDGLKSINNPIKQASQESIDMLTQAFDRYNKTMDRKTNKTMKEFNLEEAKAGKPVCTRDGRDVEILKYDRIGFNQPMITLVNTCGCQYVEFYCKDGSYHCDKTESNYDLFMKTQKKEGWMNIYDTPDGNVGGYIHNNKEAAEKEHFQFGWRLDIIKVEYNK